MTIAMQRLHAAEMASSFLSTAIEAAEEGPRRKAGISAYPQTEVWERKAVISPG